LEPQKTGKSDCTRTANTPAFRQSNDKTLAYDGFSKEDNTYAYYTEGHKDGTAKVKITNPGLWMMRVQHTAPEHNEEYDRYVARAVLLFDVK